MYISKIIKTTWAEIFQIRPNIALPLVSRKQTTSHLESLIAHLMEFHVALEFNPQILWLKTNHFEHVADVELFFYDNCNKLAKIYPISSTRYACWIGPDFYQASKPNECHNKVYIINIRVFFKTLPKVPPGQKYQ